MQNNNFFKKNLADIEADYKDDDNVFFFQLEALKRTVDRTAADFEAARSQVAELKKLYCVEGKR